MPFRRIAGALALIVAGAMTPVASAQTPATASPPAQGQPLTLQTAQARALEANPTIIAARFKRNVGEASLGVAGQRLNPELTYETEREAPRQAIGVAFPIELGGKRGRRMDLARAGVDAANADIEAAIAEVRNDVRRAYYQLAAAAERVTMAEDTRALAARMRDAADARFTAGDVPRLDAVQTALVFLDADNEVTAAGGEPAGARAELNALGQPLDTPILAADTMTLLPVPLSDGRDRPSRDDECGAGRPGSSWHRRAGGSARSGADARTADASAGGSVTYDAQPEFSAGWRVASASPCCSSHSITRNSPSRMLSSRVFAPNGPRAPRQSQAPWRPPSRAPRPHVPRSHAFRQRFCRAPSTLNAWRRMATPPARPV